MALISDKHFIGEYPRLATYDLPDGAAQQAINVDLQHGDIRGLRGNAPLISVATSSPIRAVYSEDGVNYYAWTQECYPVKSMVAEDQFYRIYYTLMLQDGLGSIIKVARTQRINYPATSLTRVIGSSIVGGNFQPPENSSVNGQGPDSWVLGVPIPLVALGNAATNLAGVTAPLVAQLYDLPSWPDIPGLQLTVTWFIEDQQGNIVQQQDVSNTDNFFAAVVPYTQVIISTAANRGNKIQDMLWPLTSPQLPRPFKYYYLNPPAANLSAINRVVTETVPPPPNATPVKVTYTTAIIATGPPAGA